MDRSNLRSSSHARCLPRRTRGLWAYLLGVVAAACQDAAPESVPEEPLIVERPLPRTDEPPTEAQLTQPPDTTSHPASQRDDAIPSCIPLDAPEPAAHSADLQIEFACGIHSASTDEYSDFIGGGARCDTLNELNTFALRLTGSAAGRYSAVVRCGYIRYDHGLFVGQRVEVEARDGEWCHEPALQRIDLVDRMLLTDVSFAIEALDATAPERHLEVQFSTRGGWTEPVPSETPLCAYVAHREIGTWACGMVSPAPDCICPCGGAWQDFFQAVGLSLAQE